MKWCKRNTTDKLLLLFLLYGLTSGFYRFVLLGFEFCCRCSFHFVARMDEFLGNRMNVARNLSFGWIRHNISLRCMSSGHLFWLWLTNLTERIDVALFEGKRYQNEHNPKDTGPKKLFCHSFNLITKKNDVINYFFNFL